MAAKKLGHEGGFGLKKLAEDHGVSCSHKTKSLAMCNWEKPTLAPLEIAYGAQDASLGLAIAQGLRARFQPSSESLAAFLRPFVESVAVP